MREQLTAEAISALIDTVTVELGDARKLHSLEMSLLVPASILRLACEREGLKLESFLGTVRSRFPRTYVQLTQELQQNLLDYGGYGLEGKDNIGQGKGVGNTYYLQMLDGNRLSVKYQQIIGGWSIGELTDDQSALLVNRITEGLNAQVKMEVAA